MIVGLCTVELFIPDGHSLKDKRRVLQSVKTTGAGQIQCLGRRGGRAGFVAKGDSWFGLRGE